MPEEIHARYRYFDTVLEVILEKAISDDTLLLILSDHGHQNSSLKMKLRTGLLWRGEHERNAVFIAYGPGVKKCYYISDVSIYDIVPTALTVLGVNPAQDMDGMFLSKIFVESVQESLALPPIATYENKADVDQSTPAFQDDRLNGQFKERLKSLGYL